MEAMVSPCSKGVSVSRRCWTGDPSYSRARWAAAAPPWWAGLPSSHVASIRGGLGGFPPIFLRRRTVILPAFPPPPRYTSSRFSSLAADTPEADAEAKMTQDQTQTRSESLKVVAETEATDFQTRMAGELQKVAAETENGKVPTQMPSESLKAGSEDETTEFQTQIAIESLGADAETETTKEQTQTMSESTTVHVKFKLQKSCQFGQQFLLVGEDPMIGLWDPASAIPMEWSDGHVWMAELDFPVGKEIKFKFILRGCSGEIEWQPGPDRVLQTWKAANTMVVEYGWENAEDQKITEEGSLAITAEREASGQSEIETDRETVENQIVISNAKHENNLKIAEEKHVVPKRDPVLVPGLAPMIASSSVSTSGNEVDGMVDGASLASGDIDGKIPEDAPDKLEVIQHEDKNEHEAESSTGQLEGTDSQLASGCDSVESDPQPAANVPENDIHWGRQTFQKFLMTLGLFQ